MTAHFATSPQKPTSNTPLARLRSYLGQDVTIMTVTDRYQGRLTAVHPKAVWLEVRDDCLVAITAPVVSVSQRFSC